MEGDHRTGTVSERTNPALGHAPAWRGWSPFPWGQRVNLPTETICRPRRDSGSKGWRFRAHPPRWLRPWLRVHRGLEGGDFGRTSTPLDGVAVSRGVEGDGYAREEACR